MNPISFFRRVFRDFSEDRCTTLAAALAYYTFFALPPLLYLLLMVLTFGLSVAYKGETADQKAKNFLEQQASQMLGNQAAAEEISTIIDKNRKSGGTWWKSLISIGGIIVGATGLVAAVQTSLNQVWEVMPDPDRSGLWAVLKKRLLSFAMILGMGFLLIVSLIVSTILTALGERVSEVIGMSDNVAHLVNYGVQAVVAMTLFAAVFKFVPDARIAWRDVIFGAAVTTVLYLIGRYALQYYFAVSDPGAQLGSAAASLAIILVWIYYMAIIFLFGAEVTQVHATRHGLGIQPEDRSVRVVTHLERPTRR